MNGQYPPPPPPPGQPMPPQAVPPQQPPPQQPPPQYAQPAPPPHPQQYAQPAPVQAPPQAPPQAAAVQTPPYWPADQTPPQYQAGPPQAAPNAPVYHAPDDAAVRAVLDDVEVRSQQRQAGGNFAGQLKIPNHVGAVKWGPDVPVGYENHVDAYLCGGWAAGAMPFVESVTHFYKSAAHPKGNVIGCSGDDSCLFCQARSMASNSPDPTISKSAKDWGRRRVQYLYNAIDLTNPQSHYGQDGQMRPFLLPVGSNLQTSLRRMFDARGGITKFVDPVGGRPIRLTKKKTGMDDMNVEYGAIDMDPAPLDQYFWPALGNVWNLEKEVAPPPQAEVVAAIMELNWPMPQGMAVGSAPTQAYSAAPQAPAPSPYPQQPQMPQQAPLFPPAPQYAPQASQPPQGQPQAYAPAPAPAPYQAPGMPPAPQPVAAPPPPPAMPQGGPPPPPPTNVGQPPPMAPPPVTSDGSVPPPPPTPGGQQAPF